MSLIRRARPGDEAAIVAMIGELAEFERAADECTVTEKQISTALFGADPVASATSPRWTASRPPSRCGSATSTWDGVAGVYLEDLFVRPAFRRRGLARALLATLARECVDTATAG
jgi:GNAT superfamily N-acetyltransferase